MEPSPVRQFRQMKIAAEKRPIKLSNDHFELWSSLNAYLIHFDNNRPEISQESHFMEPVFKEITYGGQQWKEAVRLRENILRKPLGSRFSKSELEEEKEHLQIGGFLQGVLIASAVLVPLGDEMKMQRVVVREDLRNKRIGSKMMLYCENLASQKNYRAMFCHARDSAVRFYLKNDYQEIGDYFDEDGIPHLKMSKDL